METGVWMGVKKARVVDRKSDQCKTEMQSVDLIER
jgi:hypothetical protein